MNVRGFFKNVLSGDQPQGASATGENEGTQAEISSGVSGFLSGTTKFLDSVQSKKNGLLNDLSTKFSGIKLPGEGLGKSKKPKESSPTGEDDESSASEYGDEGDKPMYAEQPPLQLRESVDSIDSLPENEADQCRNDIRELVSCVLAQRPISPELRTNFQNYALHHTGRSAFAKELKRQAVSTKEIPASVLEEIGNYVSLVLFHCNETDDSAPAAQLMQMSFTLYHEVKAKSMDERSEQFYLYTRLRDQPIWQSTRFWNAAFFIALQEERRKQTIPTGLRDEEALRAEKEMQENAAFIQISKFLWRMRALGITKDSCIDFLRKQSSAEDLPKDTSRTLYANLQKLFENEPAAN